MSKNNLKNFKSMQDLVEKTGSNLIPIKNGEMVDVKIIKVARTKILVDVAGLNTGIIPEKEFSSDVLDLKTDDMIPAYVLMMENEEGNVVLSLKRASKERYWRILNESHKDSTSVKVRVKQANRGGLIVEYGNIEGFLPVSQLTSDHYPRVGDRKDKILEHLKKLLNSSLNVKVITLEPENSKVIFSEKEAGDKALDQTLDKYKVGQKLLGKVTGVVDFGIFVDLGDIEGLVHISEVSWDKVENLKKLYKPGDKIDVEVIDISNGRISLSIKRLKKDPWVDAIKDYEVNDKVKGEVTKLTPYGAFVRIDGKLNAMFHISEINGIKDENIKNLEDLLEIGKKYDFNINNIEKKSHKISLSWPTKKEPKSPEKTEAKTKKTKAKTKTKIKKK